MNKNVVSTVIGYDGVLWTPASKMCKPPIFGSDIYEKAQIALQFEYMHRCVEDFHVSIAEHFQPLWAEYIAEHAVLELFWLFKVIPCHLHDPF